MATQSSSPPNPANVKPQNEDNNIQPKSDVQQNENTEDDNQGITEQQDTPPSKAQATSRTNQDTSTGLSWFYWGLAIIGFIVLAICLVIIAYSGTTGFTATVFFIWNVGRPKVKSFWEKNIAKPSSATETSATEKAAPVGPDEAKASKNEEKKYLEEFVNQMKSMSEEFKKFLDVQVKEMKSMSVAIRKLEEMSNTKQNKGKGKQFRWTKPMSHMMLEILAEEASKGNGPSSTFKQESFARVAREINLKFGVECSHDHVVNHMKTIKKEWKIISQLREKNGFGWNDELKMITVSRQVLDEEIMAHPNHDNYLNKKIVMYNEMALVAGKVMATGSFAESFDDINLTESSELEYSQEDGEMGNAKEEISSSGISEKRRHRKRRRKLEESTSSILAMEVREVAKAIQVSTKNEVDVDDLFDVVMQISDFDDDTLNSVFDYLVQNDRLAKAFIARNLDQRKRWIENFVKEHGGASM